MSTTSNKIIKIIILDLYRYLEAENQDVKGKIIKIFVIK